MNENIWADLASGDKAREERERRQCAHIKEAVRMLMARREGRTFLRWLGDGRGAAQILELIMDYEEGTHA